MSILKYGVGQQNEAIDHKGIKRFRQDKLIYVVGETTGLFDIVYDPDHFLYQNLMPVTKAEYDVYRDAGKTVPLSRQGELVMCTCGAPGVIILDTKAPLDWQNKLICKNVAMFNIHQTSMVLKEGQMKLPGILEQDYLLSDVEIERTMKEK